MGNLPTSSRVISASVGFALPVAATSLLIRLIFPVSSGPGYLQSLLLMHATGIVFAATLFATAGPSAGCSIAENALRSGAIAGIVLMMVVAVDPALSGLPPGSVLLVIPVFLFVVISIALAQAITARWAGAWPLLIVILGILFALPLWLGPIALVVPHFEGMSNLIVAASPLTALASTIDFDYLRTPWFYENSVLGSLRYAYPSWHAYAISLALIAIALLSAFRFSSKTQLTVNNPREVPL